MTKRLQIASVAAVISVCGFLATRSLLNLWQGSEQAPLVKWSVVVTGAILALSLLVAYLLASFGKDDAYAIRIRRTGAVIGGIASVAIFGTPLFAIVSDTLGTLAGLLLGLLSFLFSRFFGL
jgi:hypothetical protein